MARKVTAKKAAKTGGAKRAAAGVRGRSAAAGAVDGAAATGRKRRGAADAAAEDVRGAAGGVKRGRAAADGAAGAGDDAVMAAEAAAGYIRAESLGALLGLTQQRIRQLRAAGALVTEKTPFGQRYHREKSLLALCRYLLSRQDAQGEKQRAMIADADYKERKAAMLDLDLKRRRGMLHDAHHVQVLLNGGVLAVRNALLALPPRLAHDVMGCASEAAAAAVVADAVDGVLHELAAMRYDADAFKAMVEADGDFVDNENDEDE